MKLKILFSLFLLSLLGCGIKGPPLPPLSEETIQKQKGSSPTKTTLPTAASSDVSHSKKTH